MAVMNSPRALFNPSFLALAKPWFSFNAITVTFLFSLANFLDIFRELSVEPSSTIIN